VGTTSAPPAPAVERVTPALADALLAANRHNRNLRTSRVTQLAEAMERGEWELNGETIKVAEDGTLLDGQHRLQAVVESGVGIDTLVIRDLPMRVQDTVDTGRRRRLADILMIEGYPDSHALGAAVSILHRLRNGTRIYYAHSGAPSAQQALDLIKREPQIQQSVRIARRVTKQVGGPIGVFSALHCVFHGVDPEPAEDFFARLADGADLSRGDPLLHLRNQLARPRKDRSYAQSPSNIAALTIKAFNLRRVGRSVNLLAFRANEQFPQVDPPAGEGSRGG
jgi:hypothetical protein